MKQTAIVLLALMVGMTAPAWGQKDKTAAVPASVVADANTYVIGPEDVLAINVWKEPEMSASVPVRPDGKISLPLLNDVQAAGLTPMQLASTLSDKMQQFLTEPRVTVTVTGMNSKRIFLMGEVGRRGPVAMLPNMTLMQALAVGGGFSQFANLKKMYLLRNEEGKQVRLPINYKALMNGDESQNILMKPGDTIVVP